MEQIVKAECSSCGASGIYRGFAEPEGVGVVCITCSGSGCMEIKYEPFIARVRRHSVKTVQRSRGTFIGTGVGPGGESVTYSDFLRGAMP